MSENNKFELENNNNNNTFKNYLLEISGMF